VLKIRENIQHLPPTWFKFCEIDEHTVHKLIMSLDHTKVTGGPIPVKILKLAVDIVSIPITNCINFSLPNGFFPSELKLSEITPIPKAGDSVYASDFRLISILPTISKVFEKVVATQLSEFFQPLFSKFLCGFRKKTWHSTRFDSTS